MEQFSYTFEYLNSRTRLCKSFNTLMQIYDLKEEEFVWSDGWYYQLEQHILQEIGFRFNKITPSEVCELLLHNFLSSNGTNLNESQWVILNDLSIQLVYLAFQYLPAFHNCNSFDIGLAVYQISIKNVWGAYLDVSNLELNLFQKDSLERATCLLENILDQHQLTCKLANLNVLSPEIAAKFTSNLKDEFPTSALDKNYHLKNSNSAITDVTKVTPEQRQKQPLVQVSSFEIKIDCEEQISNFLDHDNQSNVLYDQGFSTIQRISEPFHALAAERDLSRANFTSNKLNLRNENSLTLGKRRNSSQSYESANLSLQKNSNKMNQKRSKHDKKRHQKEQSKRSNISRSISSPVVLKQSDHNQIVRLPENITPVSEMQQSVSDDEEVKPVADQQWMRPLCFN